MSAQLQAFASEHDDEEEEGSTHDEEEKEGLTALPSVERVKRLREDPIVYRWFCTHMVSSVVGVKHWLTNFRKSPLSNFVSVSDEAFALVNYENNLLRWQDMFGREDLKRSKVKAAWTNSGDSIKDGKSKRFHGWAKDGITQYNINYKAVRKNCRKNQEFDKELLQIYQDYYGQHAQQSNVADAGKYDNEEPEHDLPWGGTVVTTPWSGSHGTGESEMEEDSESSNDD